MTCNGFLFAPEKMGEKKRKKNQNGRKINKNGRKKKKEKSKCERKRETLIHGRYKK
jgi:hypothetical protein